MAAKICVEHNIPYVTIDSRHDSFLHKHAAVNVVSKECTANDYPDMPVEEIMHFMQQEAEELTIITQGGGEMIYARKGQEMHRMKPFSIEVKSTLDEVSGLFQWREKS